MPMDAPVIASLAAELNQMLPLKIDKIHQPYGDEFVFSGYGQGQSCKILCSLNSQHGRIHLFDGTRENPVNPSAFCMLLRKHFSGSKLISMEAIPFERIIKWVFETYDPSTGLRKKILWLELTGKSSNLIVTSENGQIFDAWRRSHKETGRDTTVGAQYEMPSTGGRWKPVTITYSQFHELLAEIPPEITVEKFLFKHWLGLSSLTINELVRSAGFTPEDSCQKVFRDGDESLYQSLTAWSNQFTAQQFTPCGIYDQYGSLVDCSAFPIHYPVSGFQIRPLASLNAAVADVFNQKHETARFQERKQNLVHRVKQLLEKSRTKFAKQTTEALAADQGDTSRIAGELLIAYGQGIPKGVSEAKLINYYTPDQSEIVIRLNPALTASGNAQAYFKKYQKAKKGQIAISVQLAKTQNEIDYLDSLATLIENALNNEDLMLVAEELDIEKQGHFVKKAGSKTAAKNKPAEPRKFISPAGHQILVGRNNIQNDRLTFKIADPNDIWFHTQKIPGSHVILKAKPGVPVDDENLHYACQLAVYFSKAQKSTKVPVDYTVRKNVKKPPASKPGFVIYDHFKTAIITPDPKLLGAFDLNLKL